MAAISDAVVIGIVLGLVFAAVSYYLYSRMTQLERKVGLMENILLDLKVTTEQTLLATESQDFPTNTPSQEELVSYQSAMDQAVEQPNEDQGASDNHGSEEDTRDVFLEQPSRGRNTPLQTTVQLDRSDKPSVSVNYEAMTYKELTALAKQYGISGLRNLSKAQVIDSIRKREGSSQPQTQQTELSSWTTSGTVNFSESSESVTETNELDAMADKTMDNIASLDETDVDGSLVQ
jgi:hypothetical protein